MLRFIIPLLGLNFTPLASAESSDPNFYLTVYGADAHDRLVSEFFTEMFVAGFGYYDKDFIISNQTRLHRFTQDPVFWFRNSEGAEKDAKVRAILTEGVTLLTGGVLSAKFREARSLLMGRPWKTTGPIITVFYVDYTSRADAELAGSDRRAPLPGTFRVTDSTSFELRSGFIAIDRGLFFASEEQFRYTMLHELMHVMGMASHAGTMAAAINSSLHDPYRVIVPQTYELEAFHVLYKTPYNGQAITPFQNGTLLEAGIEPVPFLLEAVVLETAAGERVTDATPNQGSVGDIVHLRGNRLMYRFGCDGFLQEDEIPKVTFGGVAATDLRYESGYGSCLSLMVVVPEGATTGDLVVTPGYADFSMSTQITFTVVSP